jgi:hypothetical protein
MRAPHVPTHSSTGRNPSYVLYTFIISMRLGHMTHFSTHTYGAFRIEIGHFWVLRVVGGGGGCYGP